jgi:hypothetical protein
MSTEVLVRPVALFVPEFFLYGFVSAYFTGDVWLGPATVFILWLFFFLSQAPPSVIAFELFVTIPSSVLIGAALGALVVWALVLPPLLPRLAVVFAASTRPKRENSTTDNDGELVVITGWRNLFYMLGIFLIIGPRFALWYSTTTSSLFTALFILGFAVTTILWFLLFLSKRRALWLDARYLIFLELYFFIPWLYSLLINFRPWEGVVTLVGLLALTVGVVAVEVFTISTRVRPSAPLESDPRFLRTERYWSRIAWRWFVGLWLPLSIVYAAAWATDSFTYDATTQDGSVTSVLVAVGIAAFVVALVLACCVAPRILMLARMATPVNAEDGASNSDALTDPMLGGTGAPDRPFYDQYASTTSSSSTSTTRPRGRASGFALQAV